jgi:DNA-binding LacI/PurR family transcriptional regulator
LRAAGLHCPDDLSLAAFDDHPMSRWWGLTTVSQHAHEQGVRAAMAMIKALDSDPNGAKQADELRVELVVRGTTGPAAR